MRPTLKVARGLLGCYLVRRIGRKRLVGRIVEVEAYLGERDAASHAYRGRTRRNDVMFRKGGHLYVYFTYGMHFCANVVTEREGLGRAVLLRALEPVAGLSAMQENRGMKGSPSEARLLTNGPARLCQAMKIGRAENGSDLCGPEIYIARATAKDTRFKIGRTTRVGITGGKSHLWRFYVKGNRFISPGRPVIP